MARTLILFTLLALVFREGVSIKCYQCKPTANDYCTDVSNLSPQTCTSSIETTVFNFSSVPKNVALRSSSSYSCVKVTITDGSIYVSTRGCILKDIPKVCDIVRVTVESHGDKLTDCDVCDTDGCNGATGLGIVPVLSLLLPCLVALIAVKQ